MTELKFDSELMQTFAFWSSILVIKVLAMSALTGRQRMKKKVFANTEDLQFANTNKAKIILDDPDVERIRRAHLNDLENCLPWFIMTFIWLWTSPSITLAKILIRTFVISRITHTISYVLLAQQPTRAIAFFTGFAITLYEAVSTVYYFV